MRLFKFVSSMDSVLNIATGSLKFTPIGELNDPSELTPIMNRLAVRESLEELRRVGLTEKQFNWLRHQNAILDILSPETKLLNLPKTPEEANNMFRYRVYENIDYMEKMLLTTINKIRSRVGILSLSKRYTSLPMWAHYANLAKGFVVVFNNLESVFSGDDTGSLNILKPVIYSREFKGMTFDPSTQDRLFFSKLLDWSYEKEWRVVTALDLCETKDNLYLRRIDRKNIVEIICGWQVGEKNIKLLQDEIQHLNPDVRLKLAVLDCGKIHLKSFS